MLLREDFQKAIESSVARYPAVGALVKAGDPRILQHLDAMATMLGMYSAQLEVATAEPFEKTRDSTVLADAAMRGIIRKSTPARVQIAVTNAGTAAFRVDGGRSLVDSAGRLLRVEVSIDVAPGASAMLVAQQLYQKTVEHRVAGSAPFYAIPIADSDDDSTLCGVAVADVDGSYEYRERYVNTLPGERIYHIEADERQRLYVRFGQDAVVGVQPLEGAQIDVTSYYSMGNVEFKAGSPVAFEAMGAPEESLIDMRVDSVLAQGQDPLPMDILRELAKYPSIYNHNAVFLGEFDFLVRSNFPALRFLSVWNESIEERVRGPKLENVNTLFVACLSEAGGEEVLEQLPGQLIAPAKVAVPTGTQDAIRAKIKAADDSYKVVFYTPVRAKISVAIAATIPTSYDVTAVELQIRRALLDGFGEHAAASRRGQNLPLYQQVYKLLKDRVPALQVGRADLQVMINDPPQDAGRPELWRYVADDTLTVTVEAKNISTPFWGAGS